MAGRIVHTDTFDGMKFRTTHDGVRHVTPLLTESPFIVFTANVFALMGLRQLYFLLGGLLERLVYLKYGIAVILAAMALSTLASVVRMRHDGVEAKDDEPARTSD